VTLAACAVAQVDEVYAVGGAQAIAALAFGTDSIDPVEVVVGPGNAYVNEAKRLVSGTVGIDGMAGPSELLIVADAATGRARWLALDLAAQAEHGPDTICRIVAVNGNVERALAEIEALAPEHLVLLGADAEVLAPRIRNAGAVFVGPWSAVAAGDYATGGNHVLPTGGWARAVGGLGLESFMKPVTVQRLTRAGLAQVRPVVEALAAVEGMPAHAQALRR
jgi:histidinol dehydrogenase